jgi:hypothetical protein
MFFCMVRAAIQSNSIQFDKITRLYELLIIECFFFAPRLSRLVARTPPCVRARRHTYVHTVQAQH